MNCFGNVFIFFVNVVRTMTRSKTQVDAMRKRQSPLEASRVICQLSQWVGEVGRCQWCNGELHSVRRRTWCSDKCGREWQREHIWRFARSTAKRRAKYRCTREGCVAARRDCEVNHLAAREGKGYGPGCHHHLIPDADGRGGLEVLCHAHHSEITAAQATARAAKRREIGAQATFKLESM